MTDSIAFVASAVWSIFYLRRIRGKVRKNGDWNVDSDDRLRHALLNHTSLNAKELICHVTDDNQVQPNGVLRSDMRIHNLWHRATYILVVHKDERNLLDESLRRRNEIKSLNDTYVLVQRRSSLKDYCPFKLDPLPGGVVGYGESYRENATRELYEEMGIVVNTSETKNTLERLFAFSYEDSRVRVWGDLYECTYHGLVDNLVLQKDEVDSVTEMSLSELKYRIEMEPADFMPDACHAMKLYFQRRGDLHVQRRLLMGYSSSNLDAYQLRPKPRVIFFDCDDCLYFDGWKTANQLTKKIDTWCVNHGLLEGQAYSLYKTYGTALRGLLAEGYIDNTDDAIDEFLQDVHDVPVRDLLQPDQALREMLLRIDPTIPKYIFTASVRDHASRCIQALGISDLFVDIIDCKACNLETKHSHHSFYSAMQIAGLDVNVDAEHCLFFDDNIKNIEAARNIGWRSILVGRVGRDCGEPITTEHAENEIDRIHHIPTILPELFEYPEHT
jgi:pyrimidine 5'-nucleotidase